MADLNFKAQIELIDKMTAPMRSLQSQAGRLGRQFGETSRQAKQLQSQQNLVDKFRKQSDAIKQTTERYKAAEDRLAMLSSKMNSTSNPTRTLTKQFEAAGRSFARVENKLKAQRLALSQTDNKLQEAGFSTDRLADHEQELARRIEATNRQLGERRQRLERVNQIQQQSQQMGEMRNKAAALGAGGAAATYAAARFVQPGVEFETSMSKVQAVTRLDENSQQYKALEEQARQLGATKQFTQADAARGQTFLAMAGFTPKAIEAAMPSMLDLALAGDMDLDRTADISSNILTGMKLDPTQMTDIADVLSATFTRANVDIGMLGETMKYAAPGAAQLGVDLQELGAMAGKLGDAGIQGSMGGTALRSIMSRLAAPPKAAAGAMHELGLQVTDANGNLRKMPDILQELHEKTKNLGNAERAKIFKDLGGEEAGGALAILANQAGSGELQKLINDIRQAEGEAGRLATTMSNNTYGDWKALTSGVDAFRTSIFDANKETIRGFMQSITALAQRMTAFANAHPELIAFLGKVFGILAIGAVIVGTVGAALLTVLGPMALLRASLVTLGLPTTLSPISALISGFQKFKLLLSGLRIASMLNPIGIGIMVIAGLALVLINYWQPIKAFFTGLWSGIKEGLTPLQGVFSQLKSAFDPLRAAFQPLMPLFNTFKNALISLGVPLNFSAESMSKVQAVGHALGWALGSLITILARIVSFYITGWTTILTTVISIVTNLKTFITTAWSNIKQSVLNYANQLWSNLGIRFNSGIAALVGIILAFTPVGLFVRVFSAVWGYFGGLGAKFRQYGVNMIQGLANGILSKANAVVKSITNIAGRIKGAFTGARAMDIHSPSRVFDKYGVNTMQGFANGIWRGAKWPISKLSDVASSLRKQSFDITPTLTTDASPVQNLWDRVKSFTSLGKIQGPDIDANFATDFDKYNRVVRVDADTTAFDNKMANAFSNQTFAPKVQPQSKLEALWGIAKRLPIVATAQRYLANYSPINFDTIKDTGRYFKRHDAINSQPQIATVPPISFDTRKTVLPGVGTASNNYRNSTSNTNLGGITININGASDPMTIAQQVRREIESIQRDMSARRRSRLSDID